MKKINIFTILLIIIIIGLICSYFLINYFSRKMSPVLITYAEEEVKKLTTLIINTSVTNKITKDMKIDNLFTIDKNDRGEIQLITYNSTNVNKILNDITNNIELNIKAVEQGKVDMLNIPDTYNRELLKQGIIYELPMGSVTNSFLLSNLGPKIPVKLSLIGSVTSKVDTKITEYGINNALLEVGITVDVTIRTNLPLISKNNIVSTTIPIALKVIQGTVPGYYINGITGSYIQEKKVQ